MKFLVSSVGSSGDIHPFLALAQELIQRGHDVLFATDPLYENLSRLHGVPWTQMGQMELSDALRAQKLSLAVKALDPEIAWANSWLVKGKQNRLLKLQELVNRSDVVVCDPHVHWLLARLKPGRIPIYVGHLPHPGHGDPSRYRIEGNHLFAMSSGLQLIPKDLSKDFFTGFWFLKDRPWKPIPSLENFLSEEGTEPIIFTLGSSCPEDLLRLQQAVVNAALRMSLRVVIASGWAQPLEAQENKNVFVCSEYIPYEWLFAKGSVIIHHGGSGTTGLVMQSGKPSVVVPMFADHGVWAAELLSLKLSAGTLSSEKFTEENLIPLISKALTDRSITLSVENWREKVRGEGGAKRACNFIESELKKWHSSPSQQDATTRIDV